MRPPDPSSQAGVSAAVPSVKEGAGHSPSVAAPPREAPARGDGRAAPAGARRGRLGALVWLTLAAIVAAGFYLRLHNNGYGLPYVYNYDEANHFTNHSVAMLA